MLLIIFDGKRNFNVYLIEIISKSIIVSLILSFNVLSFFIYIEIVWINIYEIDKDITILN